MDVGQGINEVAAFRVNAMYENSGSYRDDVHLSRHGINPMLTLRPTDRTNIVMGGNISGMTVPPIAAFPLLWAGQSILMFPPSLAILPQPDGRHGSQFVLIIEHGFDNGIKFRNRTRYAVYDKFYQNIFPAAISDDGTWFDLGAYNNSTKRSNVFNQCDLMYTLNTGPLEHRLLAGIEVGQQITNNLRKTGYFGTSLGRRIIRTTRRTTPCSVGVRYRSSTREQQNRLLSGWICGVTTASLQI